MPAGEGNDIIESGGTLERQTVDERDARHRDGGPTRVTLDRLRVSPCRLARGRKLTIRLRLSAASPVRIVIRRGGKRRSEAILDADGGSNRFVWSGKSKGRALPVGRYVVRASVPGSPALTASFRIVGRP